MKNSPAPAPNEPGTPRPAAGASALELEFPDWSGQVRPPSTATADEMHRLSEALLPRLVQQPDFDERRLKAKVSAEFSL
ncbi:MAG: hypothetical protein HZA89_12090 [Verrucomicrobia bacterium]|nr:hypothetical protein [Verrucomicrobiota bacterium]